MSDNHKPILGWMFYDWASQPYFTILMTFVFGPYFASVVMDDPVVAQSYWGRMLAISGIVIALTAPVLGAISDGMGSRHKWIFLFSIFYIVGSTGLWWAAPGSSNVFWILFSFAIGLIGVEFTTVLTNAMLPDLGETQEVGVISGKGWAFGYVGGLLALTTVLLLFAENIDGKTLLGIKPVLGLDSSLHEGTRAVGPFTAIWYLIFMIPFFIWTSGMPVPKQKTKIIRGLLFTLSTLSSQTNLLKYLASSMLYRDALNGVFAFGGIYAVGVLEWSLTRVGIFGLLGLVFGALFAWLGGYADRKFGPKYVITVSIIVLIIICFFIVTTSREMVLLIPVSTFSQWPDILFLFCGSAIGATGGIIQSTSRTMMVLLAPEERMAEAFGLYALAGKATAFLAPLLIAIFTSLTGNQRLGVTPLIALFILALLLLVGIDPAQLKRSPNK